MIDPIQLSDQTTLRVADLVSSSEDGDISCLDAYLALHKMSKIVAQAMSQIKKGAIDDAERFGAKTFQHKGFSVTIKNDPAKWNFDRCPSVLKKQEELDKIKELAKRAAELGAMSVVTDDGEIIEPAEKIPGGLNLSIKFLDENTGN